MDFNREEFEEALDIAKMAIDQREFIPILSHFCFSGKMLTTYNDMIGIQIELHTNFVCAIQAGVLTSLVSSVTSETIAIGFSNKTVYFKSGKSRTGVRARLPYMNEEDFFFKWPEMKRLDKFEMTEKQANDFFHGLRLCLSSVGEAQPHQMGVTLHESNGNLFLYSTNNHAISRYGMKIVPHLFENDILPTTFCNAVIKGASVYGTKDVSISKGRGFVVVSFGKQCKMYAKLIGNKDPLDFAKVIKSHTPDGYTKAKQKLVPDFADAFQRSLIMLRMEISKFVSVDIDSNVVNIEARSVAGKLKSSAAFAKSFRRKWEFQIDAELAIKALEYTDYVAFGDRAMIFSRKNYMHLIGTRSGT